MVRFSLLVALIFAVVPELRAQNAPPAAVLVVDRNAAVWRDGQDQPALPNMPVVAGDRLTTTDGRVQLLFLDGTTLDIDERSSVDLLAPTLIRVNAGHVILVAIEMSPPYDVQTPTGSTRIEIPGEYFVAADGQQVETALDFVRWSRAHRVVFSAAASPYLPADLQVYASTLDEAGAWQYAAPYGYVWYPRVAASWRPYSHGYWAAVKPYGWTWIGADRWSWPTHHYGRWESDRGSWFWIPTRGWGPAWVSWGISADYVSWCPLGVDNRAVARFAANHGGESGADRGWTVVPRDRFGAQGAYASRHAVPLHDVPRATPFVVQNIPPSTATRRPIVVQPAAAGAGVVVNTDPRLQRPDPRLERIDPRSTVADPRVRPSAAPVASAPPAGRAMSAGAAPGVTLLPPPAPVRRVAPATAVPRTTPATAAPPAHAAPAAAAPATPAPTRGAAAGGGVVQPQRR